MNLRHLGDALDHWKGSMFDLLRDSLPNLRVLPMAQDGERWSEQDLRLYARLLRLSPENILLHDQRFSSKTRSRYFSLLHLDPDWDVFVDPHTGIAANGEGGPKHIRYCEIKQLLPPNSERVVLAYQHASRKERYLACCLNQITASRGITDCFTFAYDAGNVSMVFLSRAGQRLCHVRNCLAAMLAHTSRITAIQPVLPSSQ